MSPNSYPTDGLFQEIASEREAWIGEDSSGHDVDQARRVFILGVRMAELEVPKTP